jgi:hypothetical protein
MPRQAICPHGQKKTRRQVQARPKTFLTPSNSPFPAAIPFLLLTISFPKALFPQQGLDRGGAAVAVAVAAERQEATPRSLRSK